MTPELTTEAAAQAIAEVREVTPADQPVNPVAVFSRWLEMTGTITDLQQGAAGEQE